MDEEQIEQTLEVAWVAGVALPLIVVTVVALRWVFRLLASGDELARRACRRWRATAGVLAVLAWAVAEPIAIPPELPLMVAIAALDCWLVTLAVPAPAVPFAIVRSPRASSLRSSS